MTGRARLIAVLVLVLAGCTGHGSNAKAQRDDPSASADVEWSRLTLAGRVYRTPLDTIARALDDETAPMERSYERCTKEAGFPGASINFGSGRETALLVMVRAPSMREAKRRGLNIVANNEALRAANRDRANEDSGDSDPVASPPNIDRTAAEAIGEGCLKDAGVSFNDEMEPGSGGLWDTYQSDIMDDPDIRSARDRWSACMKAKGYNVDHIARFGYQVRQLPVVRAYTEGPDIPGADNALRAPALEAERAAAVVQVECDREAYRSVIDQWAELEDRWLDDHAAEVKALPPKEALLWGAELGF